MAASNRLNNKSSSKSRPTVARTMTLEEMEFRAERLYAQLVSALKERRLEMNLTQRDLSAESGVSQALISEMECGKATPTWNCLSKLCFGLKTTIPALIIHVVFNGQDRTLADRAKLSELATHVDEVSRIVESNNRRHETILAPVALTFHTRKRE